MAADTDFPEIAAITDYTSLVAALRAAREFRQLSCETVELIGGLTKGHCSKMLAKVPEKSVGPNSLGLLLQTLGVKLVMVPDEGQEQRMRARWERRNSEQIRVRPDHPLTEQQLALARKVVLCEIAAKRIAAQTPEERSRISRKGWETRRARNGNGLSHANGHSR